MDEMDISSSWFLLIVAFSAGTGLVSLFTMDLRSHYSCGMFLRT